MLYDYRCNTCWRQEEAFRTIAERKTKAPICCGEPMEIIITKAPMGYMGRNIDYICPVTGEHVTSKQQRRNIMAREGLVSAHELMSSKEERDKKEQRVKELREQSFGPKDLRDQVNDWGRKQTA